MIPSGTDLKYCVTAMIPGFTLKEDNFSIVIRNRWQQVVAMLPKDTMIECSDGSYCFPLPNLRNGTYYAIFTAEKEDEDFDDGIQHIVDRQILVTIGCGHGVSPDMSQPTDGVAVYYRRVWLVNLSDGSYLADKDGNPILDVNGNKIYLSDSGESAKFKLSMTRSEIKQLLEGRTADGRINTMPEVMDALGGVGDDTELSVMNTSDATEMMHRILKK